MEAIPSLKDSLVNQRGFERYWDENAKAPYLFNSETNQLISYDDEESVRYKCEYAIENNMAGVGQPKKPGFRAWLNSS